MSESREEYSTLETDWKAEYELLRATSVENARRLKTVQDDLDSYKRTLENIWFITQGYSSETPTDDTKIQAIRNAVRIALYGS